MPDVPRRVRTQAEREADGTAWRATADSRPGYATYPHTQPGSPSWWARPLPDGTTGRPITGRDVARFAEQHLGVHLAPWQQQVLDDAFRAPAAAPKPPPDIWMTTEPIAPPRRRWWHRYTRRPR